jgi:hypothetical protein
MANPSVDSILAECAIAIGRGTGSKPASAAAVERWRVKYRQSIGDALTQGLKWSRHRKGVLLMSIKLGRTARRLASGKPQITVGAANKASRIIANDPTCTAGSGRFCPP